MITLKEVMSGKTPRPKLQGAAIKSREGLWEINLTNTGTAGTLLNLRIHAHWEKARSIAADACAGFSLGERTSNSLEFITVPDQIYSYLSPGERRCIGWIRLNMEMEVKLELSSMDS